VRRTVSVAERRGWDRLPSPFHSLSAEPAPVGEFLEFATALNLSRRTAPSYPPLPRSCTQISLEIPVALVNKAQLPRSVSLLHATVLRCTADRQYFLLDCSFRTTAEPSIGWRPASSGSRKVTSSE